MDIKTAALVLLSGLTFLSLASAKDVFKCTFEERRPPGKDLPCGLVNDMRGRTYWWLGTKTPSTDTGPTADHTSSNGKGRFAYLEATGVAPNSTAIMLSPNLNLPRPACLQFAYHMSGIHIGSLSIKLEENNDRNTRVVVWSRSTDQGKQWLEAEVAVPSSVTRFIVVATRGGDNIEQPYGDIAVDTLKVKDGGCSSAVPIMAATTTTPTTAKPTTTKATTAKPTTTKATTAKPTTTKATTAKPTTTKATTAKPTTTKATTAKPTTTKAKTANPTTTKATTAKPTSTKATTAKPTTTKSKTAKPTTTKATTAKSKTAKPTTTKATTSNPTTAISKTAKPTTATSATITTPAADPWWKQFVPYGANITLDVPLTDKCSVTTSLTIGGCTVDMTPNPNGCITFAMFLKFTTPSILSQITDILETFNIQLNLNNLLIDAATIDTCANAFHTEVTLANTVELIPSGLKVRNARFKLSIDLNTNDYDADIQGSWSVGSSTFDVVSNLTPNSVTLHGSFAGPVGGVSLKQFAADLASTFNSNPKITEAIDSLGSGFSSVMIKEMNVKALRSSDTYAMMFQSVISTDITSLTSHLILHKDNSNSNLEVTFLGQLSDVSLSAVVKKITDVDISALPVIGGLTLTVLDLVVSSEEGNLNALPFEDIPKTMIENVRSGVNLVYAISFEGVADPVYLTTHIDRNTFNFQTLKAKRFPAKALIQEFLSAVSNFNIPPEIDMDRILSSLIDNFHYDSGSKTVSISISSSETVELIPSFLTISNPVIDVKAVIDTKAFDIKLNGAWKFGDITFNVASDINRNMLSLEGSHVSNLLNETTLDSLASDVASLFGSEEELGEVTQKLGKELSSVVVTDLHVKSQLTKDHYAMMFRFGLKSDVLAFQSHLLLQKRTTQTGRNKEIILLGQIFDVSLSTVVQKIAHVDISPVPLIGSLTLSQLDFAISSSDSDLATFPFKEIPKTLVEDVTKGLNMAYGLDLKESEETIYLKTHIDQQTFHFNTLKNKTIPVKVLLEGFLSQINDIDLPPDLNLDAMLSEALDRFTYDDTTKTLSTGISSTSALVLIPSFLTISNAAMNISLVLDTKEFDIALEGDLIVGRSTFRVIVDISENLVTFKGSHLNDQRSPLTLDRFMANMGSAFDSDAHFRDIAGQLSSHFQSVVVEDLSIEAHIDSETYAMMFKFAMANDIMTFKTHLLVQKHTADNIIEVMLIGQVSDVSFSDVVRKLTSLDISSLPVVGGLHLDSLDLSMASNDIDMTSIPFELPRLTTEDVTEGLNLAYGISLAGSNEIIYLSTHIDKKMFKFQTMKGKRFPAKALLDEFLTQVADINIPSDVNLDDIIKEAIDSFDYDAESKTLSFGIFTTGKMSLIPSFLTLSNLAVDVSVSLDTKEFVIDLNGVWNIGQSSFKVEADISESFVKVNGSYMTQTPATLNKFISDIASLFGSDINIGEIAEQLGSGLSSVSMTDLQIETEMTKQNKAFRFQFAISTSVMTVQCQIIVLKEDKQPAQMVFIGGVSSIQLSDIVKELAKIDISNLPVIGGVTLPSVEIIITLQNDTNAIPFNVDGVDMCMERGLNLLFGVPLENGETTNFCTHVQHKALDFSMLQGAKFPVKSMLQDALTQLNIPLPPSLDIDSLVSSTINGFSYDGQAKIMSLAIPFPNEIRLLSNGIVLSDIYLKVSVKLGSNIPAREKYSIEVSSIWEIGSAAFDLSISRPSGHNYFIASASSDIDLAVGALVERFAVALLPPGLEKGIKAIGMDAFYITNPSISVHMTNNPVANVQGTAKIGSYDRCTVEVVMGSLNGMIVMATGIVMQKTSVVTAIKKITANKLDLGVVPGSFILENSDIALVIASQPIPRNQPNMAFKSDLLSKMDILDGLSMAANLKFPSDCKRDKFCGVLKRLFGASAQLVLKGQFHTAPLSLYMEATIPNKLELITGAAFQDVGFILELGMRNVIGLTGKIVLSEPTSIFHEPIELKGSLGVQTGIPPAIPSVFLDVAMVGMWRRAFGLPFLSIGNLRLRVAIVSDPIALSSIELGGRVEIGDPSDARVVPVMGEINVGLDRAIPAESFFQGRINILTIPALVKAFKPTVRLPAALDKIGFPDGVFCSFAMRTKTLSNGVIVPRGLYFKGKLSILDFNVIAEGKASLNGFFFNMTLTRLSLVNGLIRVEGLRGGGPSAYLELGWNPPVFAIIIQGRVSVLGITATTNITVDHRGYYMEITGNMLNLFRAQLKLTASYKSLNSLSFSVEGLFQASLKAKIIQMVKASLTNYDRAASRAITSAQNDVNSKKAVFDAASRKIYGLQRDVTNANRHFDNAMGSIQGLKNKVTSSRAAFDRASRSILGAKKNVASKQKDYDNAIAWLRRQQRNVAAKKVHFDNAARSVRYKKNALSSKQRDVDRAVANMRAKERGCPRPCRKRRDTSEIDLFLDAPSAKAVLRRVRRGWGFVESAKEDVARAARWAAEKTRETGERAREATVRAARVVAERTREAAVRTARAAACAARRVAYESCRVAVKGLAGLMNVAKAGLAVAKTALTVAEKAVQASSYTLKVAEAALKASAAVVDKNRWPLEAAKKLLDGAAAGVRAFKHTLVLAEAALKAAEVVVDKSRVTLDVANGVLSAANGVVQTAKRSLDVVVLFLEGVKKANSFGVQIAKKVAGGLFVVDVQEVWFKADLSAANGGRFQARLKVAFFGTRPVSMHLGLDLRNFSTLIRSLVQSAKKNLGL